MCGYGTSHNDTLRNFEDVACSVEHSNESFDLSTIQGQEFPPAFDSHIRKIHRLLFHVLAHIYHSHFREIVLLQLHAHLNAIFAHFIELNLRFNTVEEKVMFLAEVFYTVIVQGVPVPFRFLCSFQSHYIPDSAYADGIKADQVA